MAIVSGRSVNTGRAGADVASGRNDPGVSQREDLANFISMITRDETPWISSIGKTKATAIYHEWQTDSLQAPGDSKLGEGTDYVVPGGSGALGGGAGQNTAGDEYNVVGPNRSRLGNYAQINGKSIAVSGTRRAIDQAGVADEYAYQLKKRGTELRRDLEHDLVHKYQASAANGQGTTFTGATNPARTAGGYASFINDAIGGTNHFSGSAGHGTVQLNSARYATADGTAVATPSATQLGNGSVTVQPTASRVNLSLSDIDTVMQSIYQEGGKATKIMVSPKLRRDFSDLLVSDGGVRRNIDEKGKLRQSVDIYMSDFGDLMIVPNYIMGLSYTVNSQDAANSAAFIYDPMWFNIATLRPLQEVDVGQRGDSTIGMMVEECTLEVRNPIGCGAIYNLR